MLCGYRPIGVRRDVFRGGEIAGEKWYIGEDISRRGGGLGRRRRQHATTCGKGQRQLWLPCTIGKVSERDGPALLSPKKASAAACSDQSLAASNLTASRGGRPVSSRICRTLASDERAETISSGASPYGRDTFRQGASIL